MSAQKTVKLRKNTDAKRLRFGYPWVYSDEIVADRRTRNIDAGEIVQLVDFDGAPLGQAAFHPTSKIACRILADEQTPIDAKWWRARIEAALHRRELIYDAPYYRLVHGEADNLPGLIIDRFGDVLSIQPNAAWVARDIEALKAALIEVLEPKAIYLNASGRARKLEGLDDVSEVLLGEIPSRIPVPMNEAIYMADIEGGQKTGLFFDQRENHAFVKRLAKDKTVLDVFSHVGGFALAALAGGATSALAVDGSASALSLALEGAKAMGVMTRFSTRQGDAFDVLQDLNDQGAQFDIVICDPPAFAPHKQVLSNGLRAYERVAKLAAPLVASGGVLVLCSCSHAASLDKFTNASVRGIGRAGRKAAIIFRGAAGPDHPEHLYLPESSYLKAVAFALE